MSLKQADRSAGDRTQNSKKSADDGTQNAYGLTVNAVNENDERSTAAVAATAVAAATAAAADNDRDVAPGVGHARRRHAQP